MLTIASALPGRIRLRMSGSSEGLQSLAASCQSLDAVTSIRVNAAASSIVLIFDAAACSLSAMLRQLESLAPVAAPVSVAPPRAAAVLKRPRPLKLRVNRLAKLGALSSLTASLAWAATGNKRLHVVSGFAFLGCLAVHLAVYRRNLTR